MKTLWQEMIGAGWAIGGADSRRLVASGKLFVNENVATSFNQEVKNGDLIRRENGGGETIKVFMVCDKD
jgi:hypothetical protein